MTRFATFAALYVIALFLEPAERWKDPEVTALLLALGVLLVAVGLTRKTLRYSWWSRWPTPPPLLPGRP